MNLLASETSPYLLQHAQNPIHWKAWNADTLSLAREQNKLIVVSIGYSTCHWCHVMEAESFEKTDVAQLMNQHFISIKIDREERPDLDAFYMKAVQLMTKQGGWPLNVVCLPNGKPIWGGTYFRRENWIEALEQLQNLYENQPEQAVDFAEKLHEGISLVTNLQPHTDSDFQLTPLLDKWKKSFDWEYGGYARAPKFMMPNNLLYLQRLGVFRNDVELIQYVDTTLIKMAWGGIFDTVDGGFSRYAVDDKWHVPHFEKMLYDNAQLLSVYSEAFKRTARVEYAQIVEKTIRFIETYWSDPLGGYYAAWDADSLNAEGELEEGAYYVWTAEELKKLVGSDFELLAQTYNINSFGHWEANKYVLIQTQPLEAIAAQNQLSLAALQDKKEQWEALLLAHRNQRAFPRLDHKILLSWNALLIQGFVDAYTALEDPLYLDRAVQIAKFIQQNLECDTKGLYHSITDGKRSGLAFLDDYATYIQALISLFEITLQTQYLQQAKALTDRSFDVFFNDEKRFFNFSQQLDQESLIHHLEIEDNVIPASNSIMALNLIKMGVIYEHAYYTQIATHMVSEIKKQIDYASAFSNWLLADLLLSHPQEVTVCGPNASHSVLELKKTFSTRTLIFGIDQPSNIPYFKNKFESGQTLYYFCQNFSCQKPENSPQFLKQIQL